MQLCDHSWLVLSNSSNSSSAMTLLTDYTHVSGSSKLKQFLLASMRVRYGLLPSYNIGGPPTVLTVLKRLPAGIRDITVMVRCARVRPGWSPCDSTGFALQCVCTNPLPIATVPRQKSHCKLICNWASGLLTANPPTFVSHGRFDTISHVQTKVVEL